MKIPVSVPVSVRAKLTVSPEFKFLTTILFAGIDSTTAVSWFLATSVTVTVTDPPIST